MLTEIKNQVVRCNTHFSKEKSVVVHDKSHKKRSKMASTPKQKPLLPILKEKKRYITYKVHGANTTGQQIVHSLQQKLGVFDAAQAGLLHITYDEKTKTGVLKTSNKTFNKTRIAMMLTTNINNQQIMIQPLITSGILKKAKQAM